MDYLCNCKSGISDVYSAVEGYCLQAIKFVDHYANGCLYWLILGHQSINPSREAILVLLGQCKRFTFVHSVITDLLHDHNTPTNFCFNVPNDN